MVNDALNPLTKEFISIGAASGLGSAHCLRTHLEVARELGATHEQLLLSIIIGASIAETTALSQCLRVYDDFYQLKFGKICIKFCLNSISLFLKRFILKK
ncbi:MAG: carboxymuconolactone decarboxylase family protein [Methanobacteriaceae archaeon]